MSDKNKIFIKMLDYQKKDLGVHRLLYNECLKIVKHLSGDIFGDDCVYYNRKDKYPAFQKRSIMNKAGLKKNLYYNYVDIKDGIIKSKCGNRWCVTVKHLYVVNKFGE